MIWKLKAVPTVPVALAALLITGGRVPPANWYAPASQAPLDGRGLPFLSEHKAVRFPLHKLARFCPKPIAGLPELGAKPAFRLGAAELLLVSSPVAVFQAASDPYVVELFLNQV